MFRCRVPVAFPQTLSPTAIFRYFSLLYDMDNKIAIPDAPSVDLYHRASPLFVSQDALNFQRARDEQKKYRGLYEAN